MVGENKILTVSYGTFSCTLEGFEDPFSTMKAIAEYFRDLAADDRYFGAEPPQPDADMLHKIAEQTIQSRVNAEFAENSVILRQDPSDAPPQTFTATAPTMAADDVDSVGEAVDATATMAANASFGSGDTIAEKLQRIRAVVARENGMSVDQNAFFSEDQHADAYVGAETSSFEPEIGTEEDGRVEMPTELEAEPAAAPETAEEPFEEEYEDEVLQDEAPVDMAPVDEAAADEAPAADEAEDVVASEAVSDEDEATDTAQEEDATLAESAVTDVMQSDADDSGDVAEDAIEETETAAVEDVAEPEAAETLAEDATAPSDEAVEDVDANLEDSSEDAPKPRRRIIVQKISREEVEAAQPELMADTDDQVADTTELSAEAEADLLRELASAEAEIDAGEETGEDEAALENLAEAVEAAEVDEAETGEDVTSEAAPEVASDIAPVEEPTHEDAEAVAVANLLTEDETPAEEPAHEPTRQGHGRAALLVEDEDAALNRLMDATSSRMSDDGESAVRRASIAHLKAAVAATKADQSIAKAAADEDAREMDQYRDDLARVVRSGPTRPADAGKPTQRPSPLVLVSEQRIDPAETDPSAVAASNVQPRRISTGNLALDQHYEDDSEQPAAKADDTEPFEQFVNRMNAQELPEILEAAAAHFTCIEGQKTFTRPMLMRKIAAVDALSGASREEGLRCFGALLRENKIEKSGAGQFSLSATSRFLYDA